MKSACTSCLYSVESKTAEKLCKKYEMQLTDSFIRKLQRKTHPPPLYIINGNNLMVDSFLRVDRSNQVICSSLAELTTFVYEITKNNEIH